MVQRKSLRLGMTPARPRMWRTPRYPLRRRLALRPLFL